ncbi:MAG: alpha-L-fucosidase [Anaerolineae bacterium]|nr:alpha-L-fucosidase [Anaerolineae bacterium]
MPPSPQSPIFQPTWESLKNFVIPDWYQDAKFGIFIHWGAYSVPAFGNEWYPRNMYIQGTREFEHHRKTYGDQSKFGYKDLIAQFKGEKFDPEQWIDLFKQAGAKYIVPVAEHHDGFPMYDSALSRWTAVKMGPRRDVIGELAMAARNQGIIFGLSSHRIEHWWFMNGGKQFESDVQNPEYEDLYGPAAPGPRWEVDPAAWDSNDWQPRPHAKFLDDWYARCIELVDKYHPQVIYFDWWIRQIVAAPYLQRFAAYYYNKGIEWGNGVAIDFKLDSFPEGTAVFDIERGQLDAIRPQFWQICTSVSKNSWGYIADHDYKTTPPILHDLIDAVSKNGSVLLNVGPRADGTIPEAEQEMLREIGRWLAVNGEAIYGSRPFTVYGEGPTQVAAGGFSDSKRPEFTGSDVRFSTNGGHIYAILLGYPPNGEIAIQALGTQRSLPSAIQRIDLLGSSTPVQWTQTADALKVTLPPSSGAPAYTLKITT